MMKFGYWSIRPSTHSVKAAKKKHILRANGIPVIRSDRGGQVTYHGPGQIIAYVLLDIRQRNGGLRFLVRQLEEAVIRLLSDYGIKGCGNEKSARGVCPRR